jgi:WD40 repeat protein
MSAERGATPLIDAEHPWPGLMPFTENAQAFFNGRDQETEELARLIRRETLTVLFGQSGLGKSSLLNAGLFPRLRADDFLPIYIRLDVAENAPPFRAQVMAAIAANAEAHRVEPPPARPDETLWAYFHRRDADFWSPRNRLLTPVLVFDQFEEIFTLGRHGEALEGRCHVLLEELADLIENRMPASVARQVEANAEAGAALDYSRQGYKVLFSFREDYLPDFEGLRPLIRSIMQNRMRLTRMSGEQAYTAVLKSGGHLMGTDVAEHVVRFVAAPRAGQGQRELARLEVEPALLSVVCHELNNQRLRAGAKQISAEVLREGAPHQIIEDFYNTSLRDLDPKVRVFVEDQLLTDAGFRDSYPLDDAQTRCGIALVDINRLVERRLLRIEERSGILRLELTHDVLTGVARESRDQRNARRAEEERRAAEARRRAQTRRLMLFSGSVVASAVAVAVVFGVLLKQARDERRRLIETQSYVWLARANGAAEQGVAGEPYAMVAEALRLDPDNRAALMRATTLIEQRRHARQLEQTPVSGRARVAWRADDEYVVFSPGLVALRRAGSATVVPLEAQVARGPGDAGLVRLVRGSERPLAGLTFPAEPRLSEPEMPGKARLPRQGLFAYHPEARVVSLIGTEGMLHLLDPGTGSPVGKPVQLTGTPREILVSAQAKWVAAEMENGEIVLASLAGAGWHRIPAAANRPETEKVLAALTDAGALLQRSVNGYEILRPREGTIAVARLGSYDDSRGPAVASPDGKLFAAGASGMLIVWTADGERRTAFGEVGSIRDVAFSPDGRKLVWASDRLVRVWNIEEGHEVGNGFAHDSPVLCVRFLSGGYLVATGAANGAVQVWELGALRPRFEAMVHPDPIADIAVTPSDGGLVAMTFGEELFAWSWAEPRIERLPDQLVASSPGGEFVLSSEADGVSLWQRVADAYVLKRSGLGGGKATTATFAPDAGKVAIAWEAGGFSLLDTAAADPIGIVARQRTMTALNFSPTGALLAAVDGAGTVQVFQAVALDASAAVLTHSAPVRGLDFSPDGSMLATTQRGRMRLWNASNGGHLADVELPENEHLVRAFFAADGDHLIVVFDRRVVRLLLEHDETTGLRATPLEQAPQLTLGDIKVWTAAIAPSRTHLALGAVDGRARMLDLGAWRLVGETMKHDDTVLGLLFSPDETRLASWSRDHSARIWDVPSGYPVSDRIGGVGQSVAFGPAGILLSIGAVTRVQPLGQPRFERSPAWLPGLLEAIGGTRIDPQGGIERVRDRLSRLRAMAATPAEQAPESWYRNFIAGEPLSPAVAAKETQQ